MFKTLLTLARGRASSAAERLADDNALAILDQQMREATQGYDHARKALALAQAQAEREEARIGGLVGQIGDLETRVEAALNRGATEMAREGADAIAALEADRDAAREAQKGFAAEAGRLRGKVTALTQRLADLERGRRIARASDAVGRTRTAAGAGALATVEDAEATLARLRERQKLADAEADALDRLDPGGAPRSTAKRMADAGFGPRLKPTADDVLARIKARRETPPA
mgnify:CR=1 FL=1